MPHHYTPHTTHLRISAVRIIGALVLGHLLRHPVDDECGQDVIELRTIKAWRALKSLLADSVKVFFRTELGLHNLRSEIS
jgi:hypothetical protein